MTFPTVRQCLSGVLMLTALVGTTALLKTGSAQAFPPEVAAELNITPEQQTELDAIRDNARTQMDTVLTPEQQTTLEGTTGRDRKRALRQLDLSEDQRSQLRSIRETSRAAVGDVLTDEQQAQLQEIKQAGRKERRADFAEALNLTAEQQAEIDAIKENARTEAAAVLTTEQQAALEGKTGREWMQAMRSLDLSEDQRSQLQDIRETTRAAVDDVLTAEQQAQLQEMKQQRGRRQR